MSSSLWKKLFSQKTSKKSEVQTAKPSQPKAQNENSSVPSSKRPKEQDMAKTKQEIEQFQKLISKKISDPKLAKKAAQIIEDMLKENPQEKSKNNKKAS